MKRLTGKLTHFTEDFTLLQYWSMTISKDRPLFFFFHFEETQWCPTCPRWKLSLPLTDSVDAQLLGILVPIPDQQLTAWPDDLAGSVEYLPVILKGHQVLLFIMPGTVHIPGIEADEGKETIAVTCHNHVCLNLIDTSGPQASH